MTQSQYKVAIYTLAFSTLIWSIHAVQFYHPQIFNLNSSELLYLKAVNFIVSIVTVFWVIKYFYHKHYRIALLSYFLMTLSSLIQEGAFIYMLYIDEYIEIMSPLIILMYCYMSFSIVYGTSLIIVGRKYSNLLFILGAIRLITSVTSLILLIFKISDKYYDSIIFLQEIFAYVINLSSILFILVLISERKLLRKFNSEILDA